MRNNDGRGKEQTVVNRKQIQTVDNEDVLSDCSDLVEAPQLMSGIQQSTPQESSPYQSTSEDESLITHSSREDDEDGSDNDNNKHTNSSYINSSDHNRVCSMSSKSGDDDNNSGGDLPSIDLNHEVEFIGEQVQCCHHHHVVPHHNLSSSVKRRPSTSPYQSDDDEVDDDNDNDNDGDEDDDDDEDGDEDESQFSPDSTVAAGSLSSSSLKSSAEWGFFIFNPYNPDGSSHPLKCNILTFLLPKISKLLYSVPAVSLPHLYEPFEVFQNTIIILEFFKDGNSKIEGRVFIPSSLFFLVANEGRKSYTRELPLSLLPPQCPGLLTDLNRIFEYIKKDETVTPSTPLAKFKIHSLSECSHREFNSRGLSTAKEHAASPETQRCYQQQQQHQQQRYIGSQTDRIMGSSSISSVPDSHNEVTTCRRSRRNTYAEIKHQEQLQQATRFSKPVVVPSLRNLPFRHQHDVRASEIYNRRNNQRLREFDFNRVHTDRPNEKIKKYIRYKKQLRGRFSPSFRAPDARYIRSADTAGYSSFSNLPFVPKKDQDPIHKQQSNNEANNRLEDTENFENMLDQQISSSTNRQDNRSKEAAKNVCGSRSVVSPTTNNVRSIQQHSDNNYSGGAAACAENLTSVNANQLQFSSVPCSDFAGNCISDVLLHTATTLASSLSYQQPLQNKLGNMSARGASNGKIEPAEQPFLFRHVHNGISLLQTVLVCIVGCYIWGLRAATNFFFSLWCRHCNYYSE